MKLEPEATVAPFVPARLLSLVENDATIACQLLIKFLDDVPAVWQTLEGAVEQGNAVAIASTAHYLKGSLALVEAGQLTARLAEWEHVARHQNPSIDRAQLAATGTALEGLMAEIRAFVECESLAAPTERQCT